MILLIDDHLGTRKAMGRVLERAGHTVATAPDGSEGERLFRKLVPDLVIVDMLMPEKEGVATIMEMRKARPDARILAVSGGGSFVAADILRIAELLGADGTIQKPFSTMELLGAVSRCLASEGGACAAVPTVSAAAAKPLPR
jgi:DNA-binding response OmpR family regulator